MSERLKVTYKNAINDDNYTTFSPFIPNKGDLFTVKDDISMVCTLSIGKYLVDSREFIYERGDVRTVVIGLIKIG